MAEKVDSIAKYCRWNLTFEGFGIKISNCPHDHAKSREVFLKIVQLLMVARSKGLLF